MSLEEDPAAGDLARLKALAHPVRLRMLSLLTPKPMSAAELARELNISHALASFHLRRLVFVGIAELAEVRDHRGAIERRYRVRPGTAAGGHPDNQAIRLVLDTIYSEIRRRSQNRASSGKEIWSDVEVWVPADVWQGSLKHLSEIMAELHAQAREPHADGAIPVSASAVFFQMRRRPRGDA